MSVHTIPHSLLTLVLSKSIIFVNTFFTHFLEQYWHYHMVLDSHMHNGHILHNYSTLFWTYLYLPFLVLSLSIVHLFLTGFPLETFIFIAFLVGAIHSFVSILSTVCTSSFKLFFVPFLVSVACI